jgi:hypothetical protein
MPPKWRPTFDAPKAPPPTRVRDLVAELERFDPDAEVIGSTGGNVHPNVVVGVGLDRPGGQPVVVIADRERFPGRLPDMLLERMKSA